MRFKEKAVFITGGTRGRGKAMAFLEEGARVGVNGWNGDPVARFEDAFRGKEIDAFTSLDAMAKGK